MTNLLQRLARRTLSVQRGVRPVTPPLFLPVKPETPTPARPTTTAPPASPRKVQPRQSTPSASPSHTSGVPPRTADRNTAGDTTAPTPAPKPQTRVVTEPTVRERVVIGERRPPDRVAPEPVMGAAPRSTPHRVAQVVRKISGLIAPAAAAPASQKAEPARTTLEPPPQRGAPVAAKPRTQRQQKATSPPVPSIEVTIGRIEVRTEPPPVRRPARKNLQPTLTLEAYAAQRKAGER